MKRIPRAGKSVWTRANEFLLHNPLPAFIVVVLVSFWAVSAAWQAGKDGQDAGEQAQEAVEQSNSERTARVKILGEINRYVCKENNKQDLILAGLIQVSLGGESSFGQGIDRGALDPFEIDVIEAISHVQTLSQDGAQQGFQAAFKRALAQLRQKTPCNALVLAFTEASDTRDFQAIRGFFKALNRKDREVADEAAPAP